MPILFDTVKNIDALPSNYFNVTISNTRTDQLLNIMCNQVAPLPELKSAPIVVQVLHKDILFRGPKLNPDPIVISFTEEKDGNVFKDFDRIYNEMYYADTGLPKPISKRDYMTNIVIEHEDSVGRTVRTYYLDNALLLNVNQSELSREASSISKITVSYQYERFDIVHRRL